MDLMAFYEIITTKKTGQEVIRITSYMAATVFLTYCPLE